MRLSLQISEMEEVLADFVRKKYGLRDDVKLKCSSKVTFLTFDVEEQ
jgi:hypothetical protein